MSLPDHQKTQEYIMEMTRNRKPPSVTYAEKYAGLSAYTNRKFTAFMSRGMGEVIGKYDVEHEHKLIPNIDTGLADPFEIVENTWDIQCDEDFQELVKGTRWKKTFKFQPVRCHMFKHQNPVYGCFSMSAKPTVKYPYLVTHGEMNRTMNYMLQYSGHDQDQIWRIEGIAIPTGFTTCVKYYLDDSKIYFNKDFGFGLNITRSFYAHYDNKEGRFVYPKRRKYKKADKEAGKAIGWYDKPVFAPYTAFKQTQHIVAKGYDVESFYENVDMVRYKFYPCKSFKYDPEKNTLGKTEAIKRYRQGETDLIMYNYHSWRYHLKQMKKQREKI